MALVLAVVLGLRILEVAMSRRKPNPTSPDPASLALLHTLHPHAAGIDVGAAELWVCVPPGAVSIPRPPTVLPAHVRRFGVFTADLQAIAAWLHQCGVTTVAMASTGVYWIPLYDLLEQAGFEVLLVDPRQVQRAPNRWPSCVTIAARRVQRPLRGRCRGRGSLSICSPYNSPWRCMTTTTSRSGT